VAKIKRRVQALNEAEPVASSAGLARQSVGVPPSLAVMVDDHDLAGTASISECVARVLPFVEFTMRC